MNILKFNDLINEGLFGNRYKKQYENYIKSNEEFSKKIDNPKAKSYIKLYENKFKQLYFKYIVDEKFNKRKDMDDDKYNAELDIFAKQIGKQLKKLAEKDPDCLRVYNHYYKLHVEYR
jgi:hypothetical protein